MQPSHIVSIVCIPDGTAMNDSSTIPLMIKPVFNENLTRRELLRLSAAGATVLGASLSFPALAAATGAHHGVAPHAVAKTDLYSQLLQSWCDGLLTHQVTTIQDPGLRGAFLCPACGILHGRCGDAVYPLLRVAHATGDAKYLRAALLVHEWSEKNLSRSDGSWVNDLTLSSWKGITVFRTIALAEALHHHGTILDAETRRQWTVRVSRAAQFLDGFITIETGNINYPITASLAFVLCGQLLNDPHYLDRAHELAHASLDHFTANGFIAGEGHPVNGVSAKHCRPVDLGYNVEESLPALALYAQLTNDTVVLEKTIAAMRTHMEFMLPDGGWDNSWGTRNYKWSYWGSRTSDGCHPAFVLLAQHDPKFHEVAQRNLELMAACTHHNLLYGGPDYFVHGDKPCIHHNFTHAKALATVLDRGTQPSIATRTTLPREDAAGLKHYPEIGTYLLSPGDWRATVTENDFNYVEDVQTSGSSAGGGHATGGALTMLYHRRIGPVLAASMTEYAMVEISNQQAFTDAPHMTLTPRVEYVNGKTYTSLSDFAAHLSADDADQDPANPRIRFEAYGQLLTAAHQPLSQGSIEYRIHYMFAAQTIEILAAADVSANLPPPYNPIRFILPVIARADERVEQVDAQTVRIHRKTGTITVRTDAQAFEAVPKERTFNLVPGFECVPLTIAMQPGKEIRIQMEVPLET
jgi:hypothetical protein